MSTSVLWSTRHVLPFLIAGSTVGMIHAGVVSITAAGIAIACACTALLTGFIVREVLLIRREKLSKPHEIIAELRILIPSAVVLQLLIVLARSAQLELGAMNYLFALVVVTFFSRGASIPSIMLVLGAEWLASGGPPTEGLELNRRVAFSLFMVFFSVFALAFLRTEIGRLRAKGRERIEQRLNRISELARDYRLMSAPSSNVSLQESESETPSEEEERRRDLQSVTSSLHEIHSTIYTMLDVVRHTMKLHSCVLLWKDEAGEYLKILEAASDSGSIAGSPVPVQFGVTGIVMGHGTAVRFCPFTSESSLLPYYDEPEQIASFCAVPVMEDQSIRGVLCADRLTEDQFTDREMETLETISQQAIRVINNERIFLQLAKSKTEQARLYQASTRLRAANSSEEVLVAAFESARSIVNWEMAAATSYNPDTRRHHVIRAEGLWAGQLQGFSFGENNGLVSQAVRMRYHLPYKGQYDQQNMAVLTKRVKFKGARSLIVLPLVVRDRAIGTLVLASRRENLFTPLARPLLQVIADQTALSYQNALMVQRLEEMATTDGLTGLHNKRVFLEALSRKLTAASRFGKPISLIMTDLDKFKSVNDTYGHQVGDEVLKRFSAVLQRNAREVDMACRYGGEEFVIICEETDSEGAFLLAERIRAEMQDETFNCGQVEFKVTCSLGVATGPEQGSDSDELIVNADEALYNAKRSGRNRVVTSTVAMLQTG